MPAWLVSLLSMLAPLVPPLARWLEGRVGAPGPAAGVAIEAPHVDDGDEEARRAARERAAVGGVDVTPVPTGEEE